MNVKVLKEMQLKCRRRMVSYCTRPVRRCFSSTFLSLPPTPFYVFILLIQPPPVCWLTDPHSSVWLAALNVCACVCVCVRTHKLTFLLVILRVFLCVHSCAFLCLSLTVPRPSGFSRKPIRRLLFRGASVSEHKGLVKRLIYSLTLCLSAFPVFHSVWRLWLQKWHFVIKLNKWCPLRWGSL